MEETLVSDEAPRDEAPRVGPDAEVVGRFLSHGCDGVDVALRLETSR